MNTINQSKKRAAIASTKLIEDGQIVGLGTGSTATYMIKELGRRIRTERLRILAVPTSNQTAELAKKEEIPLTTLDEHPKLDIAIDGADQVDLELNLIKGMGGALTREKVVAGVAGTLVIIVDKRKIVPHLGAGQLVPVEVLPFAKTTVLKKLTRLGGRSSIRLSKKNCHYVTDNGNMIIDVDFGVINGVKKLEREIKMISGVIECGLFVDMADIVFVGETNGVKKLEREGG